MPNEVSIDELEAALAAGGRVVDVREAHEFDAGRVPGAVPIPMSTVTERVEEFRGGDYLICGSGGRSMRVAQFLAEQGIETTNVAGGTSAWINSGRAVEVGDIA